MQPDAAPNPRIQHLLDVIIKLTAGELSVRAPVSDRGDELDAIATGLNWMAEEMERSLDGLRREREELDGRVSERTTAITLLSQLGEMLLVTATPEETYRAVAAFAGRLFPAFSGAVYIFEPGDERARAAAIWGEWPPGGEAGEVERLDCWALRRGRLNVVEGASAGVACKHTHAAFAERVHLCAPLLAQSEVLGIFHLVGRQAHTALTPSTVQLVGSLAEHLALSLSNLRLRESLRQQSIRDPLTRLYNRRYLEESLAREVSRAERSGKPIGVIMADIDHFKKFNDTYGHEAGDEVLRAVAAVLKTHARASDIACRYGGEELTLILPEATLGVAWQRAELLREKVQGLRVHHGGQHLGAITMSLGVAVFPDHGATVEAVIQMADAALYKAKQDGRNRVESA